MQRRCLVASSRGLRMARSASSPPALRGWGALAHRQQWKWRRHSVWIFRGIARTPSPHDGAFSWGPRVWRRLPLPIAKMLGPSVVRLIP